MAPLNPELERAIEQAIEDGSIFSESSRDPQPPAEPSPSLEEFAPLTEDEVDTFRATLDIIRGSKEAGLSIGLVRALLDRETPVVCMVLAEDDPEDEGGLILRPMAVLVTETIADRLTPPPA